MTKRLTIAIDGHSSGGKSTFARAIAARLGYLYVDSGAMYRAVALWALEHGMFRGGELDEAAMVRSLGDMHLELGSVSGSGSDSVSGSVSGGIFLNGEDVSGRIRSMEVSDLVSRVSSVGAVRELLVARQREMGRRGGVVMDGRDIGTVVFPDAELKIFLTADPAVRARRRFEELRAAGHDVSLGEVERNIRERDRLDETREVSPLRKAPDAVVIDNSDMTFDEQMEWFMGVFREKQAPVAPPRCTGEKPKK